MITGEERVVVTGLGVASPLGIGIAPFWDALIEGVSGIKPIQAFDAARLPAHIGGELPTFKAGDYVPKSYRKSVKLMSRDIEVAVAAAYEACKDANLPTRCLVERGEASPPAVDPTRLGANIGAGLICPDLDELSAALASAVDDQGQFSLTKWGGEGMDNLTPLWLLKFLPNMLACHVTIVHDAQALSNTITCGEASSHLAIGEAYRTIARGAADVSICGGAESKINPMGVARAALMKRLALGTDADPARACRPFAADRCGTVVAEGGGLVILESLAHARKRGAHIYAELVGFGAAANTHGWVEPDPTGRPVCLALRNALADAGLTPGDVDLAGAFGCGTVEEDAAELAGWAKALGDRVEGLPAVTTRGVVGNSGAGSGAIDFCATVLSLYHNTLPPSINTDPPDPACKFRFAHGDPVDCKVGVAASTATALAGGQSAALVIRRFEG